MAKAIQPRYQQNQFGTVAYWKNQAERAIAERELVKRSLEDAGGPATFWRNEAKRHVTRLSEARDATETLRRQLLEYQKKAIDLSESLDAKVSKGDELKRRLWDVWSGLEDGPLKEQLWELWTQFE